MRLPTLGTYGVPGSAFATGLAPRLASWRPRALPRRPGKGALTPPLPELNTLAPVVTRVVPPSLMVISWHGDRVQIRRSGSSGRLGLRVEG